MKNNMDQIDFNFSRPLDFQRNLKINLFENLYKSFLKDKSKYLQIKHYNFLLLELFCCWHESKDQFLTISMSKRGYKAKSRYNPNSISSYLINVVKKLEKESLIEYFPGFYDAKKNISRQTRIRASEHLIKEFKNKKFVHTNLINNKHREFVFLRDLSKNKIEYEDTFQTHEIREIMKNYNLLLEKTLFDIPNLEKKFLVRGDGRKILISDMNSTSNINFVETIDKIKSFSGAWWKKIDLHLIKQNIGYFCINNSQTNYIDLSCFFESFLEKNFNKNFDFFRRNRSPFFKNNDQLNYFIIKGIQSKNFNGFFRSFLNDQYKLGFEKKINKRKFELLASNFLDKNSVFKELFFKNIDLGWQEFVDNVFFKLMKKFSPAEIPIFQIKDKVFFSDSVNNIVIEEVENIFQKLFNLKRINFSIGKCYDFNSKRNFFNKLLSKEKVSERYEERNKEYLNIKENKG